MIPRDEFRRAGIAPRFGVEVQAEREIGLELLVDQLRAAADFAGAVEEQLALPLHGARRSSGSSGAVYVSRGIRAATALEFGARRLVELAGRSGVTGSSACAERRPLRRAASSRGARGSRRAASSRLPSRAALSDLETSALPSAPRRRRDGRDRWRCAALPAASRSERRRELGGAVSRSAGSACAALASGAKRSVHVAGRRQLGPDHGLAVAELDDALRGSSRGRRLPRAAAGTPSRVIVSWKLLQLRPVRRWREHAELLGGQGRRRQVLRRWRAGGRARRRRFSWGKREFSWAIPNENSRTISNVTDVANSFLGDVVGEPGRRAVIESVPRLKAGAGDRFRHRQRRELGCGTRHHAEDQHRPASRREWR